MVHFLRIFFVKNIILAGITFSILNFAELTATFDDKHTELVRVIRNKLNPEQHFLAGEEVIFGEESTEIAYQKAISKTKTCEKFPFFAGNTFFQYDPRILAEKFPDQYEIIFTDPKKTYVYNRAFRITLYREDRTQDEKDYYDSCLLLSEYISQQKLSEDLKNKLKPGEVILYHPLEAFPFIAYSNTICGDNVSTLDYEFPKRWKLRHFNFPNEMLIQKPIPHFKFRQIFCNQESTRSILCRKFCTAVFKGKRYIR